MTLIQTTPSTEQVAQALYIVNRNAKAAPDPRKLYEMKRHAIAQLLKEGKAKKVGLHFSPNPKTAQQRSDTLIQIGDYFFHQPPTKEDKETLPHLGARDGEFRNPKVYMSLREAKNILSGFQPPEEPAVSSVRKPLTPPPSKRRVDNTMRFSVYSNLA
ncbi:YkyB family protein [Cytobacillus sp. FJAT-54145]|uniref:YkyB family protein n=1 Tax=Cytobacillus spartinae TaxID=3299023 RepID=A0ABW6KAD3_9BACI